MAKKRIHQIAKELDIASADILFHAKELGIEVKTASSGLTEEEEQLVKLSLFPEPETESIEETTSHTTVSVNNEDANTTKIKGQNIELPPKIEKIELEEYSSNVVCKCDDDEVCPICEEAKFG